MRLRPYSGGISFDALLVAAGVLAVMTGLRAAGVTWLPVYVLAGAAVWLAVYESGVHATIAGALLGLLAPARPVAPGRSPAIGRRTSPTSPDRPS